VGDAAVSLGKKNPRQVRCRGFKQKSRLALLILLAGLLLPALLLATLTGVLLLLAGLLVRILSTLLAALTALLAALVLLAALAALVLVRIVH
jgi:hypothetical protein